MSARSSLISDESIKLLATRSNLWGAWLTLHVWGCIIGSIALFLVLPNILTFIFAFLVVGSRQHGLAILVHEAAHGVLFSSRKLNDFVGHYILGAAYGGDMYAYRQYHLKHHRYTQTDKDPDLALSSKFPVSKASLRRKFIRDLTGQTFIRVKFAALKGHKIDGNDAFETSNRRNLFIPINIGFFIIFSFIGYWWVYFALWLLPLMTWFMCVLRIRNIAEHGMTAQGDNPLTHARTVKANPIARFFLAPYWVNYHIEHHAYMYVPCYNLPRLHHALISENYGDEMEQKNSYSQVLKHVTTG